MTVFSVGDHVEIMPWSEDSATWASNLWGKTATVFTVGTWSIALELDEPIAPDGNSWCGTSVNMESKHLKLTDPEKAAAAKAKLQKAKEKAEAEKKKAEAEKQAAWEEETKNMLITCHCGSVHEPNFLSGDFYQPLWWSNDEQFCARVKAPDDFYELYPHGGSDCAEENQIDPVQLAADFYLLEATKNGMLGDNDDPALIERATQDFDALVAHAAPLMREYLWWSVCSELTYHAAFKASFRFDDWTYARYGWDLLMQHYGEEQACDWAMETFTQEGMWGGSFGGKPWANIVQVLKWKAVGKVGKQKFSDAMFLDRMFSLQHNTCTVFNKCSFKVKNDWKMGIDRMTCSCYNKPDCGCKNILNMHAHGNMTGMMALASPEVVKLVQDQWKASGYGNIEADKSPYCSKGCGNWSLEDATTCNYHTEKPCVDCEDDYPVANMKDGKCSACWDAAYMSGYRDSIGTSNCWNCNSELIKDSSLETGFCSVCRGSLSAEPKMTIEKFLQKSVFAWDRCGCNVKMTPAYVSGPAVAGSCGTHPKSQRAYDAYVKLVEKWAKSKSNQKAPGKKKQGMPVYKIPSTNPSFSELLKIQESQKSYSFKDEIWLQLFDDWE